MSSKRANVHSNIVISVYCPQHKCGCREVRRLHSDDPLQEHADFSSELALPLMKNEGVTTPTQKSKAEQCTDMMKQLLVDIVAYRSYSKVRAVC